MKVIERLAAGADDAFPDAEGGAAELQPVTRSARAVVAAVATRNRRALRISAMVFPSLFSAQGAVLRSGHSPGTYGDQLAGLRGVLAVMVRSLCTLRSCRARLSHSKMLGPTCLLYTSDAADDLTRVDLGGCRIIKK